MIQYLDIEIGRVEREINGSRLARERIKAERTAHGILGAKFGDGRRGLVMIRKRRTNCTLIHPFTLRYIADFPHRWIEAAPEMPMTKGRWRQLAARMESYRKLLMPRERDKQAEAVKEAIALARTRANGAN